MTHNNCPVCKQETTQTHLTCKDYTVSGKDFGLLSCLNCGFLWTDNAPAPDEMGPYYQSEDYIAHTDTRSGLINQLFHITRDFLLRRKNRLIERKIETSGRNILDIGCGTGYFMNFMKQNGWTVEGIEPSAEARVLAKSRFDLKIHPPEDLQSMPDGIFDVITLWHVLEHIHDFLGTLFQLHRLLTEKGLLVIALPNWKSWDAQHYGAEWAAYDVPRHLWHFSPESFSRLIEDHPFQILEMKPMPMDAFYVSMLSEKHKRTPVAPFAGLIYGLFSNVFSLGRPEKSSSVIYLLKKK